MTRETLEKLGSIFLAVFSTGLALVMAAEMGPAQRIGAIVAVAASLSLAAVVRKWPHPTQAKANAED
jgi:hypothetical protein